jgi:hypothetical protein
MWGQITTSAHDQPRDNSHEADPELDVLPCVVHKWFTTRSSEEQSIGTRVKP